MFGAARDGTLLIEEGDIDELREVFDELGDDEPWRKAGDHVGTASALAMVLMVLVIACALPIQWFAKDGNR